MNISLIDSKPVSSRGGITITWACYRSLFAESELVKAAELEMRN